MAQSNKEKEIKKSLQKVEGHDYIILIAFNRFQLPVWVTKKTL